MAWHDEAGAAMEAVQQTTRRIAMPAAQRLCGSGHCLGIDFLENQPQPEKNQRRGAMLDAHAVFVELTPEAVIDIADGDPAVGRLVHKIDAETLLQIVKHRGAMQPAIQAQ